MQGESEPQPLPSPTPTLHLGPSLLRDPRGKGLSQGGEEGPLTSSHPPRGRKSGAHALAALHPQPWKRMNREAALSCPPPQLWAGARGQRGRGRVTVLRCSLSRPRDGPPRPLPLNKPWPLPSPFSWISLRPKSPITVTSPHRIPCLLPPLPTVDAPLCSDLISSHSRNTATPRWRQCPTHSPAHPVGLRFPLLTCEVVHPPVQSPPSPAQGSPLATHQPQTIHPMPPTPPT